MTVVALVLTPVVLLYQGWTYYVFRHRIGRDDLDAAEEPARSARRQLARSGPDGRRLTERDAARRPAASARLAGRTRVPASRASRSALATALRSSSQATLLGRIVDDVFLGHRGLAAVAGLLALLAGVALARGLLAWAFEAGGHLAGERDGRRAAAAARRPRARRPPGRSRGHERRGRDRRRDAASTRSTRTSRATCRSSCSALVVPLVILVRVATLDVLSAVVMAADAAADPGLRDPRRPRDRRSAPARATPRSRGSRATSSTSSAG